MAVNPPHTVSKWKSRIWFTVAIASAFATIVFVLENLTIPEPRLAWGVGIIGVVVSSVYLLWPFYQKRPSITLPKLLFASRWLREAIRDDIANLPTRVCRGEPVWDFEVDSTEAFVEARISIKNLAVFPIRIVGFYGKFIIDGVPCLSPAVLQNPTQPINHLSRSVFIVRQPITGDTAKKIREYADKRQALLMSLGACYIVVASRYIKRAQVGLGDVQGDTSGLAPSAESVAEMVLFIKDLQAVAKKLHANVGNADSVSGVLDRVRSQTEDQLTKFILPKQDADMISREYQRLESDTVDFEKSVDKLTPTVSMADLHNICWRLTTLIIGYSDSFTHLQRFLSGLKAVGILPIWEDESWGKVIYPTLVKNHNALTELVKTLLKDAPKTMESSLPREHNLTTI